jgi:uncharacterized protein (DUF4415 family)
MTRPKWPSFETWDLDVGTEAGDAEVERRWRVYDREMKALIAKGGVHQDRDGWWVDDATGELIGPDPEIERPMTEEELANAKPFAEVFPELAASIRRNRGRPKSEKPRAAVTLRLDPDTVSRFAASGPGWRRRMAEIIEKSNP